jgi:hypothetical protein
MQKKNSNDKHQLIWSQHLHKVGRRPLISTAEKNKEQFYPCHYNGNPVEQNGWGITIWQMAAAAQRDFVDYYEERGVTFVATEWGHQNYGALRQLDYYMRNLAEGMGLSKGRWAELLTAARKKPAVIGFSVNLYNRIAGFREKFKKVNSMGRGSFDGLQGPF